MSRQSDERDRWRAAMDDLADRIGECLPPGVKFLMVMQPEGNEVPVMHLSTMNHYEAVRFAREWADSLQRAIEEGGGA